MTTKPLVALRMFVQASRGEEIGSQIRHHHGCALTHLLSLKTSRLQTVFNSRKLCEEGKEVSQCIMSLIETIC